MVHEEMATRYDASQTESKWYARWEDAGLFQPEGGGKPGYSITIPPPNITGSLHMGHALCYSLQDLLGRYKRLRGFDVLILPGQDHAGIATQSVVEKQLRKEGTSGAQLGREKFVERVWEWREESGDTILHQLRSLGCGFDWSRLRFTLDDDYAAAVLKVFVDWYERGLIFKGKRVINWDPALRTTVSDIETERKTVKGKLYHIRYPFADGSGHITIATTRPETMLADVAVAVHPSDRRYNGLIGKTLRLPLVAREIPLIEDPYPDPEFGTGAVKITPAHDPNDYQVGVRHNLAMPVLLDERARITPEGGPYAGMDRYEARKRIVADLEEAGLLEKVEDHEIAVLVSERSGETIEPLLAEQWFADQKKLAEPAIEAVRNGSIRFFPERYTKVYLDWMENIREWTLSRQLWWGHRIPIYYDEAGKPYAALSWEEAQAKAGDAQIVRQEEDVLDTWFSSGLWPFATLGWPQETEDLKRHYSTDVLVTSREIIYLWVARMIMMGLDLAQEKPFQDVFIYATVLTEDGRRMSKSLGTGVDPMKIIDTHGADALRYTLLAQTGTNQDLRYSDRRTEEARNFCNKIWNAARFVLMNVGESVPRQPAALEPIDLWLLSRLASTEKTVREAYEGYDVQTACQALYRFFWGEVCDWYIEICKPRLSHEGTRQTPQWALITALEGFLKMMHPVMPHITEEIYQHLPIVGKSEFLMSSEWPSIPEYFSNSGMEAEIDRAFEITRTLRSLRSAVEIPAMKTLPTAYAEGLPASASEIVRSQAWFEEVLPGRPGEGTRFLSATVRDVTLHLPIEGLVDLERQVERLDGETDKLKGELEKVEQKLSNPMFVERAKTEIVEREQAAAEELRNRLQKMEELRALLVGGDS
jgi:valyl-tRNA synthetase